MLYEDRRLKGQAMLATLHSHPVAKAFLAGSLSGTCSTLLFQPLDLLKTRVQLNGSSQLTMRGATASILAKESLAGLWRGVTPSLLRTVPGVGLYFASMHGLKSLVSSGGSPPSSLQSVLIGGLARSTAGILTIPITVVKIRYESGAFHYGSTREALRSIFRVEGMAGLTSGLLPTLVRDVPFSGLYLMFYERLKGVVNIPDMSGNTNQKHPVNHFVCGILAGVLASLVTQPADVIKTRLQLYNTQNNEGNRRFGGNILSVSYTMAREEGWKVFFCGSVPRMLRRTMMAALAWTVYERAMRNIGIK